MDRTNVAAPLFILSQMGTLHAYHTDTLQRHAIDLPSVSPRSIHSTNHAALILFRDDTLAVVNSDHSVVSLSSRSQTDMFAYQTARGWIAKATAEHFTVQSVVTGQVLIPPITVPHNIRSIHFAENTLQPHIVVTTTEELFHFPVPIRTADENTLVSDDRIRFVTALQLDRLGHETRLDGKELALLTEAGLNTTSSPEQRLNWLIEYSTKIKPETWSAKLRSLQEQYNGLSDKSSPGQKQRLAQQLSYSLIASQQFAAAYELLISEEHLEPTPNMLYQATVLAAWMQDRTRYHQSLTLLVQKTDPRIPQNFVYLVSALSLSKHTQNTNSVSAAIDRLPPRLKENPLIQRCLVGFALSQNDRILVRSLLDQVPQTGVSLPFRIYYRIANEWVTPTENRPSQFSMEQLKAQIAVLPALSDGNPGSPWVERCLLDLLLRTITSKGDAHRK